MLRYFVWFVFIKISNFFIKVIEKEYIYGLKGVCLICLYLFRLIVFIDMNFFRELVLLVLVDSIIYFNVLLLN